MGLVIWGVITFYTADGWSGQPLYCGNTYTQEADWVAMPHHLFESGDVVCGDRIGLWVEGEIVYLRALDTGPLGEYCVRQSDMTCTPIVADLPEHLFTWEGLSVHGYAVNSEPARERLSHEAT